MAETIQKIKTICVISIVVLVLFGFGSLIVSCVSHFETDNIIIDGDDIDFYEVTDDGTINIFMKDGTKYIVKLPYDNELVDFTVNSEIYIELYRNDISFWWWDGTKFGGDYYLERIIKIPNMGE